MAEARYAVENRASRGRLAAGSHGVRRLGGAYRGHRTASVYPVLALGVS